MNTGIVFVKKPLEVIDMNVCKKPSRATDLHNRLADVYASNAFGHGLMEWCDACVHERDVHAKMVGPIIYALPRAVVASCVHVCS